MNKIRKKRVVILIMIIVLLIVELRAFKNSRANKVSTIELTVVDNKNLVGTEVVNIEALNDEKLGVSFVLPKTINNKNVSYYVFEEKTTTQKLVENVDTGLTGSIQNEEETIQMETAVPNEQVQNNDPIIEEQSLDNDEETGENSSNDNEIENTEIPGNTVVDENNNLNEDTTDENIVENTTPTIESSEPQYETVEEIKQVNKKPGEIVYLSPEEQQKNQVTVCVEYETQEAKGIILYNQEISCEVNEDLIKIKGFIPNNASIKAEMIEVEEVDQLTEKYLTEKESVESAYDIKIIVNNEEYNPADFDKNVQVSIQKEGLSTEYKVVHIDNNNETEEIPDVKIQDGAVVFDAKSFSTYVLISEDTPSDISTFAVTRASGGKFTNFATNVDVWDGSIAKAIEFGTGTEGDPYLITTGAELAYLASQVNSGNSYEGKYFQLACDIDLDNIEWTPIGNETNSFKGFFDGQGRIIGNTTVKVTGSASNSSVKAYGFFGSIGNGTTKTTIKNIQFENTNVSIEISGQTSSSTYTKTGFHIGIVTGNIYNNAEIYNITVKNSYISSTNSVRVRSRNFHLLVGSIAGCAQNYNGNYNDPGEEIRYSIRSCYANTEIDLSTVVCSNSRRYYYMATVQTGGIIGNIYKQPVWPDKCLYSGNITSNGFIGPIFGAVIQDEMWTNSVSDFSSYWNGNQVASNIPVTSYYTNFTANGNTFTSTVTSGNSTAYIQSTISNSNINGVRGVNKGIYVSDKSTIFDEINSQYDYVYWKYEDSDLKLIQKLYLDVEKDENLNYTANVIDEYARNDYRYKWYKNSALDEAATTNQYKVNREIDHDINLALIVDDTIYRTIYRDVIKKYYIDIEFNEPVDNSITAKLVGTGLEVTNVNDYKFQWYKVDVSGDEEQLIEGANSLVLTGIGNLSNTQNYKLVATNTKYESLSAENSIVYGNQTVIYVDYSSGNDNNNGLTPERAVKTLNSAYQKFPTTGNTIIDNVAVIMGEYTGNDYIHNSNSTAQQNYAKKATLTGKYQGKDYEGKLYFGNSDNTVGRRLYNDTQFQNLIMYGSTSQNSSGSTYLYAQGHSLTMGKKLYFQRYSDTANAGALVENILAPDFHIIGGFSDYDRNVLDDANNNAIITVKSGTYARIIAGSRNNGVNNTAHNFTGTSTNSFKMKIIIDIEESTSSYKYDVNLLVGGQTDGNIYGDINLDIRNGKLGRILGGSIGYSRTVPNYPSNSFFGSTKIDITGANIDEVFGGSLGRLQQDVYYYGTIEINISGGTINNTIYGVGAGGVTGYSERSTDPYKSYGKNYNTKSTINISGGTINGNIYGAGYGYSAYLDNSQIATDGGAFYGNSYINITGGTINGDIYGAGRGYSGYSGKTSLAQMYGDTNITIDGSPIITGKIYGAGEGISGYQDTAKLFGNTNIYLKSDFAQEVYGAGNISGMSGKTNIYVENGKFVQDIYAGGNLGNVEGTANIYLKSGTTTTTIYGGGNQATVNDTIVNIEGGEHSTVYGGGNQGIVTNSLVNIKGGKTENLFGGGNKASVNNTEVKLNDGEVTTIYGGGNQASVETPIINLIGGKATNVYGGGKLADSTTSKVNALGSTVENIYGGGEEAGVTKTNVILMDGNITNVFGGSNKSGIVNESNVSTSQKIQDEDNTDSNPDNSGDNSNEDNSGGNTQGNNSTGKTGNANITAKATARATETWENTQYPTLATINVVLENPTDVDINTWDVEVYIADSVLNTNYTSTDIAENNGTYSFNQQNRYYGINAIPANGSYSLEFTVFTNQDASNVKLKVITGNTDGSEEKPTTPEEIPVPEEKPTQPEENPEDDNTCNVTVQTVYGGNNQGGTTNKSNVVITAGNIFEIFGGGKGSKSITTSSNVKISGTAYGNVYGGGNEAATDESNVEITGTLKESAFGGGNKADVKNTNILLNGAIAEKNVYGGGNEGTVSQNTNINCKNSVLNESVYAGGNGIAAVVYGNTNINVYGTSNLIKNSVFGGGNKAETGTQENNNSISNVNITGATIEKNVYGGANTSVVYGTTKTKIGYDAVGNTNLEKGDINILGTVFGGGEANEAGDEEYDFSYISVTEGTDIKINGNGHNIFNINGSIFGSGNASSSSGPSYIELKNYGNTDEPKSNISLQRATRITLDNSAITLSGTTDRTNEYSTTAFSISRVDEVKLKNGSTLFLCTGANLLKKLVSVVDTNGEEKKSIVTVDSETGEVTEKNVDNRVYMLEGKNLNIATNEQVTAYGQVKGMIFFGIFTNKNNPATSTGLYYKGYSNGDDIVNEGTFSLNSYILAQHTVNHNTSEDGFYTNFNNEGKIKVDYIETTPADDVYYIWTVGEKIDVTTFELDLVASKYATLGTYEMLLKGFSDANIKMSIIGFSSGLENGISLVDPNDIEAIAPTEEEANSIFGLTMKTGNSGWQTKGSTSFLTADGGKYIGRTDYNSDNSNYTPTFNFCFYHAENISEEKSLGDLRIRLLVQTPVDDLNYKVSYIDIVITLSTALFQNDFYEAAMTPGQEFGLFTSTETTITNKSAFSTYYSLYINEFSTSDYYKNYNSYKRVLVSRQADNKPYVFPANTKLTMLDLVTNKYYYYIVSEDDVSNKKYKYELSDFIAMGSTDLKFDEVESTKEYYNSSQDLIYENFIFHINFVDVQSINDIQNNTLLMELQDQDNETLLGVLGIQRDKMLYSLYNNKDATIKLNGNLTPEVLYLGKTANLDLTTNFTQKIEDSKTIYDTQFFDKKLGIKISIYDSNNNKLNIDSLFGVQFELDGKVYYPRIDGTTRINIAEKVTDVLARLKISTLNNTTLATGDYTIKVESFGSPDGIYYGLEASDSIEKQIKIINSSYGLKASIDDKCKIIDKESGKTLAGNNILNVNLDYSSSLTKPKITMSLYRRDYSEVYSKEYSIVDLAGYVKNKLINSIFDKEYIVSNTPTSNIISTLSLNNNLKTGTYKLVFKLYDDTTYIGEDYVYIVIK